MRSPKVLHAVVAAGLTFLFVLFILLRNSESISRIPASFSVGHAPPRLHFLTVATQSELNLCRLVLSSTVLSYPKPLLIDWAGEGEYNATETHLAKIVGPLRYLDSVPRSRDNDIVLMVDGYDVVMQLGPDVLLQRYFDAIKVADTRLKARLGDSYVQQHNIYDSILFGPDKTCFPDGPQRSACWAIPDSPLPHDAFGPDTDMNGNMTYARPRWLNSGTIMGPVGEVRALFRETMDKVSQTWDPDFELHNSDQLYFGDVWGDQEYARTMARFASSGLPDPENEEEEKIVPVLTDGHVMDMHVTLDYDSRLFQSVAGYEEFLDWMTFHSPQTWESETLTPRELDVQEDVLASAKPFSALTEDSWLSNLKWTDVSLGINVATGFVFPILHFTGDKGLRDFWWPRMWFFPNAERLLHASEKVEQKLIGDGLINGMRWEKFAPYRSGEEQVIAWSDRGDAFSWKQLCGEFEEDLYRGWQDPQL